MGARELRCFRFTRLELGLGDDRGKGLLHPHRLSFVLGVRVPQTRVPVYTSFLRMMWTPFLDQSLPVGLAMPSSLRVRVMARIPLPA